MNSKDIKPWRDRARASLQTPSQHITDELAAVCMIVEIAELRQALEAAEAREIKFASEVSAKVCAIERSLGIKETSWLEVKEKA